jgi:hypothetical protein
MKMLIYILFGITLAGCFGGGTDIKVVETEGWTDLMPGTPGKTYVHITLQVSGKESEQAEVTGVQVSWNDRIYKLDIKEYNYKITPLESDEYELFLRTVFQANDKNLERLDAEIELTIGKEKTSYEVTDIKIEKVY